MLAIIIPVNTGENVKLYLIFVADSIELNLDHNMVCRTEYDMEIWHSSLWERDNKSIIDVRGHMLEQSNVWNMNH